MSNTIVGISEMRVSKQPGEVLVTYSLGSCLGVVVYDPATQVGGDDPLYASPFQDCPGKGKIFSLHVRGYGNTFFVE